VEYDRWWFTDIAMSSTGQYQTTVGGRYDDSCGSAADQRHAIYISSDYGNTWTSVESGCDRCWYGVAVSSTGQYQTAVGAKQF
jgi:hypothetical protein